MTATSWKTTSAGVLAIVGGLTRLVFAIKAGNITEEAIITAATAILTGVGLMFARDNNVTSEDVQRAKDAKATKEDDPPYFRPSVWIIAALFGLGLCGLVACKSGQQRIAYNTLYSVERTTTGAYDGYIDSVIKGISTTNGVPKVSSAYNKYHASFLVALDAVQYNTNALAPAALVVESQDVVNLIRTWKGK